MIASRGMIASPLCGVDSLAGLNGLVKFSPQSKTILAPLLPLKHLVIFFSSFISMKPIPLLQENPKESHIFVEFLRFSFKFPQFSFELIINGIEKIDIRLEEWSFRLLLVGRHWRCALISDPSGSYLSVATGDAVQPVLGSEDLFKFVFSLF